MARDMIKHRTKDSLYISPEAREKLDAWLLVELTDAISSRFAWEAEVRENLRMYENVPKYEVKNFPIPNAPNIEVGIGAIAVDSLYAQALDLIFSTSPLVTCRPQPKAPGDQEAIADAKAIQRWLNYVADSEAKIRAPVEEFVLDDTQLGTGILYCPWVERVKKTKAYKLVEQGPRLICLPPEDVISFGASNDEPNLAIRFWLTQGELAIRAKRYKWDVERAKPAGATGWVRQRRESLGRVLEAVSRKGEIYDIFDIYCTYDIDDDGIDEDLLVVYSQTGQASLKVSYNPYDRQPISKAVYQRRSHLWYGLGVMTMMTPYENELTDVHNYGTLNMLLANTRFWKAKEGSGIPDNVEIWPNKVQFMRDTDDLAAEQMGDVYSDIFNAQIMITQLAEKRVGVNELLNPRASAVMGNRTPGITALSLLQQVNKRFASAFDGMRLGVAEGIKQCAYRYQEALLRGSLDAERHIIKVLGHEDGGRVIKTLKNEEFDENVVVELTASSASVNRESDRQNAMLLVNILSVYYQRTMELISVAANPQTPEPVREVAKKIAAAAGEMIDRTIRTFDQVRDPSAFVIEMSDTLDAIQAPQQDILGLLQMLGMGGGGAPVPPGGMPPAAAPGAPPALTPGAPPAPEGGM